MLDFDLPSELDLLEDDELEDEAEEDEGEEAEDVLAVPDFAFVAPLLP